MAPAQPQHLPHPQLSQQPLSLKLLLLPLLWRLHL
jgi:hypothetical protein